VIIKSANIGGKMIIRSVEREDGTYWVKCPKCECELAQLVLEPESIKPSPDSIDRSKRAAPTINFQMKIECASCESPIVLHRVEVSGTVPL
jgi:hypothetical protein